MQAFTGANFKIFMNKCAFIKPPAVCAREISPYEGEGIVYWSFSEDESSVLSGASVSAGAGESSGTFVGKGSGVAIGSSVGAGVAKLISVVPFALT